MRRPTLLCLDRTNWKIGLKDVNLLVLCIATRRVRMPILWLVLGHGGSSTMAQRQELLNRFITLFGKRSVKLLLADREFVGGQWFDFLVKNGIPFSIRVRGDLNVRLDDGYEGPVGRLASTHFGRRRLMKAKGCFDNMDKRFEAALCFAAIKLPDDSLLILAASFSPKKGAQNLQKALADRVPVRRHQDARLQHGGHTPDPARQAQPAARPRGPCHGMEHRLRPSHQGQTGHCPRQPRIPPQIMVQNRLRHAQTLDHRTAGQGNNLMGAILAKGRKTGQRP